MPETIENPLDIAVTAAVRGLFISPCHNFFGHHGREAGSHPTLAVAAIESVAGHGVRGDRFFDYAPDYTGQITFFSLEVFDALRDELGLADALPEHARRNVVVSGVDLNTLVGVEFSLQGIRFFGTEQCRPCYWMDLAFGPGANVWLRGRGGLRARILSDGILRCSRPAGT
jgi:MOSC domain-containing protein YiiM